MEFRQSKRTVKSKKKSKNHALSVMPSVFIAKKRLVTSLLPSRKNTTKLRITAQPLSLENVVKSNVQVMMVSPVVLLAFPMLGVLENHNLTNVCVVVTRYFGEIVISSTPSIGMPAVPLGSPSSLVRLISLRSPIMKAEQLCVAL